MRVSTRSWLGLLVVVIAAASVGLLIRNAESQEEHGHAKPILLKVEASDDDPFGTHKSPAREEREHAEAEKREHGERPTERDILKRQIEVFKIALHGLMEAEKKDAAEVLQRAIRAREVTLEGRRDDEAHMIREHAPSQGQLAEILALSSKVWREFHDEEKAAVVGRLAEEFARQPGEREGHHEHAEHETRERAERPNEREVMQRQLVEMRAALPALREGERGDAVELLERAIHGYEVMIEGRKDDEAHMIRERMPNRGQLAEILMLASKLWREFHNQDKAEVVGRLAREFAGEGKHEPERAHRGPEGQRDALRGRLHELERAFVRAREAGKEDEAARIRRQMQEIAQHTEGRPAHRPPAPQGQEEMDRLRGAVRELNGQVNEMRREMAEMRKLLEKLVEQKPSGDLPQSGRGE